MENDKKEIKYLKKIIKESVKEALRDLKLSENCSNDAFRIEDYWDLNSFTEEQIESLNVDYSIFLCSKGYGYPLQYHNGKISIQEGIEKKTYPYGEVKSILKKEFNFNDWQIQEQEGCNKIKTILLIPAIGKNVDIVVGKMQTLGWHKAFVTPVEKLGYVPLVAISFDPVYQDSIKDTVRKWRYIFHISPLYNKDGILQKGLLPSSQNSLFKYPPRVYFLKPTTMHSEMEHLVKELYKNDKKPNNNGLYCIYRIDLDKVPENVDFFFDPRYEDGIYTDGKIPRQAITYLTTLNARI